MIACNCPTDHCHCTTSGTFYVICAGTTASGCNLPPYSFAHDFDRDAKKSAIYEENKETHRQFASRKAGLPFMFRRWYR